MNDAIWDVANCDCGTASGVTILVDGPSRSQVHIVGNTIDRSAGNGIRVHPTLTGIGRLALDIVNDIFSRQSEGGVLIDSPVGMDLEAGHNDFYLSDGSDFAGLSAGEGNLSRDPRYVNEADGDLRLRSSSPLVDRGLVCSRGGVVMADAAGNARLAGRSVDIGAFEHGSKPPSGVARVGGPGADRLTGTAGADILCGDGGRDRLVGKAGRDYLDGGADRDTMVGGSGQDRLYGGFDDDTLCARDGKPGDVVDGGSGRDKARTDTGDRRRSIEATGGSC
jgi:Ca2+-binding RTX toxin-like protein